MVYIYHKDKDFIHPEAGDFVKVDGNVRLPLPATNPRQFDYKKYLSNIGIFTLTYVKPENLHLIQHPKFGESWFFIQKLSHFKDRLMSVHKQVLKSPKLEILGGLVFGDVAVPAPDDVKKDFMNSGLLHVLAASGVNVTITFGIWAFIASRLLIPKRLSIFIGAIIVLVYSVLTGLPPSVVRAALMIEFVLFGKLLNMQADVTSLVALVCAIMLIYDPFVITNIGFQLSFIVTFGLLICATVLIDKLKPIPVWVSGIVIVPLVAQIWATPIQLFHFNNFAPYSIFANILIAPLVEILTPLGFVSSLICIIPLIGTKICMLLDWISIPFIALMLKISGFIPNLPYSLEYFATPGILSIFIYYALVLTGIFHIKSNFSKKWLNPTLVCLAVLLCVSLFKDYYYYSGKLEMIFFDVGEADSTLIQTPERKYILIDTASINNKTNFCPISMSVLPYLRSKGINKIDTLILTHPDSDHIGGTISLLENVKTSEIIDNGVESKSKTYRNIEKYIKKHRLFCRHANNGEELNISNQVKMRLIKPPHVERSHNEDSLILYIKYKKFSALLMADNEADSLQYLKNFVKPPINIIRVGHHGSLKSVDEDFLEFLKPDQAIISVGRNKYSHPRPEALECLKNFNIKIHRTDLNHAAQIDTDGLKSVFKSY